MLDSVNKSWANTITLVNIVFGSLSLISTLHGDYKSAAIYILLAGVADGLDGRIARKFGIMSEMGKELDSLCDLVSFGVAPAILLYAQVLYSFPYSLGLVAATFYIMCGAFRLARFNVMNISGYFVGIPITLSGALLAPISWFASDLSDGLIMATIVLFSVLMVSTLKVRKF